MRFSSLDLKVHRPGPSAHSVFNSTELLVFSSSALFPCVEVLFRELVARETALRHYIHYLKESGEQRVLLDLFRSEVNPSPKTLNPNLPHTSTLTLIEFVYCPALLVIINSNIYI